MEPKPWIAPIQEVPAGSGGWGSPLFQQSHEQPKACFWPATHCLLACVLFPWDRDPVPTWLLPLTLRCPETPTPAEAGAGRRRRLNHKKNLSGVLSFALVSTTWQTAWGSPKFGFALGRGAGARNTWSLSVKPFPFCGLVYYYCFVYYCESDFSLP